MTKFEELAKELNVEITTDTMGLYTEKCAALAQITTEIILSDDEEIFNIEWEEQKSIIKNEFYRVFPYMAHR